MRKKGTEALCLARIYRDWLSESASVKSPHTIQSYKETFRSFMCYLEDSKGLDASTFCSDAGFSKSQLTEWMSYMKERGLSPKTCNARLSVIRS